MPHNPTGDCSSRRERKKGRESFLDSLMRFQHGIEDREQFSHAGSERDHLPDNWIKAGGDDGTHVENCAHLCAATPQRPAASRGAAIAIQRRDADLPRTAIFEERCAESTNGWDGFRDRASGFVWSGQRNVLRFGVETPSG
jgi:hypothetical protein